MANRTARFYRSAVAVASGLIGAYATRQIAFPELGLGKWPAILLAGAALAVAAIFLWGQPPVPAPKREDLFEVCGFRRSVLLGAVVIQLGVAIPTIWIAREDHDRIHWFIAGVVGLGAVGLLGPRGSAFRIALGVSFFGLAMPYLLNLAPAVDNETVAVPVLGDFNGEGVGILWIVRIVSGTPIWLVYWSFVLVRLYRQRVGERRGTASQRSHAA